MREASSLVIIDQLLKSGARINTYDPVAMDQAKKEFPADWLKKQRIKFTDNAYSAVEKADALVLVTEWKTFRQPDFKKLSSAMKQKIIFDGRNQYDPEEVTEYGFEYHGIGREQLSPLDL